MLSCLCGNMGNPLVIQQFVIENVNGNRTLVGSLGLLSIKKGEMGQLQANVERIPSNLIQEIKPPLKLVSELGPWVFRWSSGTHIHDQLTSSCWPSCTGLVWPRTNVANDYIKLLSNNAHTMIQNSETFNTHSQIINIYIHTYTSMYCSAASHVCCLISQMVPGLHYIFGKNRGFQLGGQQWLRMLT